MNTNISGVQRLKVILILGLLSALAPFSIDMYLPGFPAIAEDLHTSVDAVSYSLASFFVGVCIGQLVCGPLLDRYGRKKPLMMGLIIYIIASVSCAISPNIETLIFFRFIQALGGCVGMVAPRAIVRDIFPLHENAKILSLLILILGVSPMLAPSVGSLVIAGMGWNYLFLVLAVVAFLMLTAVFLGLKESKEPDPTFLLKAVPILSSYVKVFKEPQFYTYALAGGVSAGGLFAYVSGSPFVFMKYYQLNEQQYGAIFALISFGLISSSQINTLLLKKFTSVQVMKCVLIIQSIIGLLLLIGSSSHLIGLYGTVAFIFLFLSCQGFCFPNSGALSMAPFTREAGSASALMGALQMGLGALSAAVVGLLTSTTPFAMMWVMSLSSLLGLAILLIGRRKIVNAY